MSLLGKRGRGGDEEGIKREPPDFGSMDISSGSMDISSGNVTISSGQTVMATNNEQDLLNKITALEETIETYRQQLIRSNNKVLRLQNANRHMTHPTNDHQARVINELRKQLASQDWMHGLRQQSAMPMTHQMAALHVEITKLKHEITSLEYKLSFVTMYESKDEITEMKIIKQAVYDLSNTDEGYRKKIAKQIGIVKQKYGLS